MHKGPISRARKASHGFTILELLLATLLMLLITGAVFAMLAPADGRFAAELEAVDMQQRLRVVTQTLGDAIAAAGAGSDASDLGGPLVLWLPPVLPFRRGAVNDDPPGSFEPDTITVFSVPSAAARGTLAAAIGPGQAELQVNPHTGCPLGSSLCGFKTGMTVLVYGPSGAFDTFTVLSVTGAVGQLKANRPGGSLSTTYGAGLPVAEVVQFTYYLKTAPTGDNQLMRYDGTVNAGVPVVDHVVDLRFEYLGEPRPPRVIRPVTEPDGPWTTYGPRPPLPYTDNCIFAFDSAIGAYLSTLGNLDSEAALVPLTATELSDGDIWCPNAADPRRYDADLLRIRAVTVTARVQSAIPSFRGPAGPLFWNAGTSTHAARLLPDQEVRFQASIRNVGMTR